MWRVLGNASLDESAAAPRPQLQRRPSAATTSKPNSNISNSNSPNGGGGAGRPHPKSQQEVAAVADPAVVVCDGKYRITGTMRKGATGILYSAVQLLPSPTPAAAVEVVAAAGIKGGGGHLGDEGYRAAGDEERRTAKGVPGVGVVLKVEECAAPKRQMQNEWQVYRALEAQRVATQATPDPLPAAGVGGFPRAEFYTIDMPSLPSSLTNDLDGERGGIIGGGGGAVGGATSRVDGKAEGSGGLGRAVNVLAMEMLGENLMTLSQGCRGGRFSLQATLRLGAQMVSLLRMLHSTGYVHRDIKPENFCVGRGRQSDRVFLIDYGLACRADLAPPTAGESTAMPTPSYSPPSLAPPASPPSPPPLLSPAASSLAQAAANPQPKVGTAPAGSTAVEVIARTALRRLPRPPPAAVAGWSDGAEGDVRKVGVEVSSKGAGVTTGAEVRATGLVGSVRYLSVAAHQWGARQTRRCDLESLGYVLIFLVRGKLPWQGLTARTREAHMEKIRKSKVDETPDTLCKGLPALAEYLSYLRNLPPGEPADYALVERIFTEGLRRRGFPPNAPFDWMNAHHPSAVAVAAAAGGSGALRGAMISTTGGSGGGGGGVRGISIGSVGGSEHSAAKRPRMVVVGRDVGGGGGGSGGIAAAAAAIGREGKEGVIGKSEGGSCGGGGYAVVGQRFASRRIRASAASVLDLYADVPPPDETAMATAAAGVGSNSWSFGGANSTPAPSVISPSDQPPVSASGESVVVGVVGDSSSGSHEGAGTGDRVPGGEGASGTDAAACWGEDVAWVGGKSARPIANNTISSTFVDPASARGTNGGQGGAGGGGSGAGDDFDVSAALAKLRPHLVIRGTGGNKAGCSSGRGAVATSIGSSSSSSSSSIKKLPRACQLLETLMSAKMTADNEHLFFDVLVDAVAGFARSSSYGNGSSSSDSGGSKAASHTVEPLQQQPGIAMSNGDGGGGGVPYRRCRAGLKAEGVAGEAVRHLVAAACSRSGVFFGHRKEEVEAWAKEGLEVETAAARDMNTSCSTSSGPGL